jgi:hypothetical protein
MLTIVGGLDPFGGLIRFSIAIKKPKVALPTLGQAATTIAALGAAAVAHSVSRIASSSSPFVPGSEQLLGPEGGEG